MTKELFVIGYYLHNRNRPKARGILFSTLQEANAHIRMFTDHAREAVRSCGFPPEVVASTANLMRGMFVIHEVTSAVEETKP